MFTKTVNGQELRKATASGIGNDCAYLSSPDADAAVVFDSKAGRSLALSRDTRNRLVAVLAAGALALGILVTGSGILGDDMTHDQTPTTVGSSIL